MIVVEKRVIVRETWDRKAVLALNELWESTRKGRDAFKVVMSPCWTVEARLTAPPEVHEYGPGQYRVSVAIESS